MPFSFDIHSPPSPAEIQEQFTKAVKSCFPGLDDSALQPAAPLGMLVQQLTLIQLENVNNVLYEINKRQGNVQGLDLDAQLINNFGLVRKPRSHGVASITIYGEPFYTVPAGFEVMGTNTPPFRLLNEATIPQTGEITVDMQEVDFSTKGYAAHTLEYIVTTNYNIHRVRQSKVTTPGVPAETDADFLRRAYMWGGLSNNSSFTAIMARVAAVPGVTKCNGYENNRTSQYTHQGTEFAPHSVGVVAYGGVDFDIATAIHNAKPPGTVLVGDTTVKLQVGTKEIEYTFYRPTSVPLKVNVKVKLLPLYPNNYEEEIKNALTAYVATLQINARILYSGLTCMLHTLKTSKNFQLEYEEITMSRKSAGTQTTENIDLNFTEMATLSADDITVTKI